MKKVIDYFLQDYTQSDFKYYGRVNVLLVLDLIGILIALIQLMVNISSQVQIESLVRKIVLPLILSLLFFINLFIIKYYRKKDLAGNILVISLLTVHISFLAYYAPGAHFTYFVAGFYHALLFYALSAIIGTKRVLLFNTIIILVGFNLSYFRAIPGVEHAILYYAKTAYINYQVVVITLGVILYSSRWLTEKALENMQVSQNETQQYAQKLKTLFEKIKKVVRDLISISKEISQQTNQISSSTAQQAINIEEISTTLEQNTSSLNETAANSKATEDFAAQTAQFIETNLANFSQTADSIKSINEHSAKIDEIAEKTEILAINAAIEAARSQNTGQGGFSVISTEIKKLAEKSQGTAKYIKDLVKVSAVLSQNSNENIIEIKKLISDLDRRIQQIAYAAQEQKDSMQQINSSLVVINDVAQRNSTISEEFSNIVENLKNNTEELQQLLTNKF